MMIHTGPVFAPHHLFRAEHGKDQAAVTRTKSSSPSHPRIGDLPCARHQQEVQASRPQPLFSEAVALITLDPGLFLSRFRADLSPEFS